MDEDLEKRIEDVRIEASNIQGWLRDEDGIDLYNLARFCVPIPNIVELGSWKGKSTVWLVSAIKDRGEGRVYAVDYWKGSPNSEVHKEMLIGYQEDQLYNEFLRNLKQLDFLKYVQPIKMDTKKAISAVDVDLKIGLLYIDASHEYEDVRQDFEFWSPMVVKGGYIVFDDVVDWPGPKRVVSELPKWYKIISTRTQCTVQKL